LSVERTPWNCCRFIMCLTIVRAQRVGDASAPPSWNSSARRILHNRSPAGMSGEQGRAAIARPFCQAWEITASIATLYPTTCDAPSGLPWARTRSSIF